MVQLISDHEFDNFVIRYNFRVLSDSDDGFNSTTALFNSIWCNASETKFLRTSYVVAKMLKENAELKERIDKLEKILEQGLVIDDEDRALLILKHK